MRSVKALLVFACLWLMAGCTATPAPDNSVMSNPEQDPVRMQAGIELAQSLFDSTHEQSLKLRQSVLASSSLPEDRKALVERVAEPYFSREYLAQSLGKPFAVLFTPAEARKAGRLYQIAAEAGKQGGELTPDQKAEILDINQSPEASGLQWKMQVANQLIQGHFVKVQAEVVEKSRAALAASAP